jgi:hypothetical protein
MGSWPTGSGSILGVCIFALGMGLLFALAGALSPEAGRGAIPASLAFTTIAVLGGAVVRVLKAQEDRLRRLEERGTELERTAAERGAAADRPRD